MAHTSPSSDRHSPLRPVDLARAAGVSTQQVRNYEQAGVLPPVSRTPSGYRVFHLAHLAAMRSYRALAAGHGPETAREVMRSVHAGDPDAALELVDAGHARLHEERRSLRAAAEALEAAADQHLGGSQRSRSPLRIGELAAQLGVRASAVRVWEAAGLLSPEREPGTGYRRFGAALVREAEMIAMLRRSQYPLPRIKAVMDDFRQAGSRETLRAAIAERRATLARRSRAMLAGAAALCDYLDEHGDDGA